MVCNSTRSTEKEPRNLCEEIYRKKLLYISTHRGTKEGDLIIGGYAQSRLKTMDFRRLQSFSFLLTYPDFLILEWIKTPHHRPQRVSLPLLKDLKAFIFTEKLGNLS